MRIDGGSGVILHKESFLGRNGWKARQDGKIETLNPFQQQLIFDQS